MRFIRDQTFQLVVTGAASKALNVSVRAKADGLPNQHGVRLERSWLSDEFLASLAECHFVASVYI